MTPLASRPLAYGYMRIIGVGDRFRMTLLHRQMSAFARGQEFTLGQVFVEVPTCRESSFERLVSRLKQGDATELIVPTLDHFTRFPSLQEGVVAQIEALGVTVWVVGD
ncbi:recombinase family protein [Nocardiopsis sp. NRRL B-16309]|uniref:recombinase family protein n=1 Tax=Nocardiopsis sp. NRRL B-16309 TaxID=1519494 RepID=UPI0006C5360C|nr:recombinase family protein [Nocardiopsis sp. NRRL B-16309]KOX19048.1 hypothetical protein ADL05_06090 [Nocardiopsis sp. NRRL B-16309]